MAKYEASRPRSSDDLEMDGGRSPQTLGSLALESQDSREVGTREQRRSRRKRAVRARTISIKRMTRRELELGRLLYPNVSEVERPRTREHCAAEARPCPFVSCKYHLYLDVSSRSGAIKFNFPDLEVWEMAETCVLDVADRGGLRLEDVGVIMNLTRERVRQLEVNGLVNLTALDTSSGLRDGGDRPPGKRALPVLPPDNGAGEGRRRRATR